MILEVEHLSFAYRPERPLFYDVSFAFEQGQVLSILGANGAGKSTLLNCIANLLLPQQGEIRLHGTPLSRLELREISRIIGYVPQSHTPAYDYTVRDFVVMGRAPHLGTFQQPGRADYDLVDATLEETQRLRMEEVARLAADRGVPFDDFNGSYQEMGLTLDDFYDQRHLNGGGAVKFTDYFAYRMSQRYPDLYAESEDAAWQAGYEAYAAKLAELDS